MRDHRGTVKIPPAARSESGAVLVVGLVLVVAIGGLAMAFMRTGAGEAQLQSAREQGVRVYYVAEAGLQAAIVDIKNGRSGNLGTRDEPLRFGGGSCWVETVDHGDMLFTLTSCAILGSQRKALRMTLAPEEQSLFTKALFGDLDLRSSGSVFADSYDTEAGTYAGQAVNIDASTGETYARARGHLGSNGDIQVNGSVTVFGDATPGPGHAVLISGGSTYISGSTAPAPAPMPLVPVVYDPPIPASGNFSRSSSIVLNAGAYHYRSFKTTSDAVITFRGDVTIWVDGDFSLAGQSKLVVDEGAKVVLYHRGTAMKLTGGGVVNKDGLPGNFKVYSVGSSVDISGGAGFYGAIYAPNAIVTPSGTSDVYGSFVGRQIKIVGGARFHFDEALSRTEDSIKVLHSVSVRRAPFPED